MKGCDKIIMGGKEIQYGRGKRMTIATYNEQHTKYIKEMQDYIQSLKKMEESAARMKAKESLIRSGVLKKDGTAKKQICGR